MTAPALVLPHATRSVVLLDRATATAGVLLIASMAVLLQAYQPVKAALLLAFFALASVRVLAGARVVLHPALVIYYVALAFAGIVWAMVGFLREGNAEQGALEAMRLYTIWSFAFLVTYSLLRSFDALRILHRALVLGGIAIAVLNVVGLADQFYGWGLMSRATRTALDLFIGFQSGYVRINSQNIGALFLIVPYLLALHLRSDSAESRSVWSKLALAMALVIAVVSGRRALWLAVAAVPATVLVVALLTGSLSRLHRRARHLMYAYLAIGALSVAFFPALPESVRGAGSAQHLLTAFSSQDERTIQSGYLLDGFADHPVIGSGFGAYAGYLRSEDRPWTYEMTYHQMLFNAGLLGMLFVGGLVALALGRVLFLLRREPDGSAVPFALVVGWCSILIGAWSNPYLRSFDYLFLAGVLPLLLTYDRGFRRAAR